MEFFFFLVCKNVSNFCCCTYCWKPKYVNIHNVPLIFCLMVLLLPISPSIIVVVHIRVWWPNYIKQGKLEPLFFFLSFILGLLFLFSSLDSTNCGDKNIKINDRQSIFFLLLRRNVTQNPTDYIEFVKKKINEKCWTIRNKKWTYL